MKSDVHAIRELLMACDPCPAPQDELPLDARAEATLHRLLTTDAAAPEVVRSSARRRRLVSASVPTAAAALIALVSGVLPGLPSGSSADAATPSPLQLPSAPGQPAKAELLRLAAVASRQPAVTAGRYHYLKRRAWYLNTAVAGQSVTSQLQPQTVEQWLADDGSGRIVTARDEGGTVDAHRIEKGARTPSAGTLPTDPAALAQQLLGYPSLGQDNAGIPNGVERVERTVDLLSTDGAVPPALQAALWRVLAASQLTNHGVIIDRAGRRGVAFTVDSAYTGLLTRYMLIIDPTTGRLLDYEQVLTKTAGKLNVRVPAVIAYEIFLRAGNVGSDTVRPQA